MVNVIATMIIMAILWVCFMVFIMPILALIIGVKAGKEDSNLDKKRNKNAKE